MTTIKSLSQLAVQKALPAHPKVVGRLIEQFAGGRPQVDTLVEPISSCAVLSWRVLHLANLQNPKAMQQDCCLSHALSVLGSDALFGILLSASIDILFDRHPAAHQKVHDHLRRHALQCAILAKLIAADVNCGNPEHAYLAGLFHDLGKWVLLTRFPNSYRPQRDAAQPAPASSSEKKQRLDIDAPELGAHMLSRWPHLSAIADAVRYHQLPLKRIRSAFPLVKILHTAHVILANRSGSPEAGFTAARVLFDLNADHVDELKTLCHIRMDEARSALNTESPSDAAALTKGPTAAADAEVFLKAATRDLLQSAGLSHCLLSAAGPQRQLQMARRQIQLLTGIDDVLFMRLDRQQKALVFNLTDDAHRFSMFDQATIPMDLNDSLPVIACRTGTPVDSFTRERPLEAAIVDHQLIRHLGRQGMACIPMVHAEQTAGCILLGIDRHQLAHLNERIRLLWSLAASTATVLIKKERPRQPEPVKPPGSGHSGSTSTSKVLHEINTPLNIVKNYLRVLESKLNDQNEARDDIRIIGEEISRIGELLNALRSEREARGTAMEAIDVNDLLAQIVRLVDKSPDRHAQTQFHLSLDDALPPIKCDRDKLKQVLLNLITNSMEALPAGGNVHVCTQYIRNESSEGGTVRMIIEDDGPGLPEGMQHRIFEPGFSSKKGHRGFGLSIVTELLKQLNGRITHQEATGTGTRFLVEFDSS